MIDKLKLERLALLVMAWCALLIVLACGFAAGIIAYTVFLGPVS